MPKYSIDDYFLVQNQGRSIPMFQQGRFGQALLVKLLRLLELDSGHAHLVFVVLALATWALMAVLVVRWWGLKRDGWLLPLAASLIAIHPFTAEIFTFRSALGTATLSLTLFCLLLLPLRWSPARIAAGAALFAFTLSIYQVVLHFALMILLVGAAVFLARYLVLGSRLGWSRRWAALGTPARLLRHRQTALAACIVLGTGAYFVAFQAVLLLFRVATIQRTQFLPLGDVPSRMEQVLAVLRARFLDSDPLVTPLSQKLLLGLLAVAVLGLLVRAAAWLPRRQALLAWLAIVLLALAAVWSIGLILFLSDFWPAARVMSHIGVFWCGVLAIAWTVAAPRLRPILATAATLVVLSFIGADNHVLDDQRRANLRDAMTANRIVARLEGLPRFREIRSLSVHGGGWRYPQRLATVDHDMNISAFGAEWAKVQLLREISGYDWKWGESATDLNPGRREVELGNEYCRDVEPWPGAESVAQQGNVGIVCMPPPP